MSRKTDSQRDLAKEAAAAAALKEALKLETDDTEAIRDTIEGETNLHDAIAAVMDDIREDEILVAGIESLAGSLSERKKRLEDRIGWRRAAVERAMAIGELPTLTLPDATLSLKTVPQGLTIVDEAKIPAKFWKAQDPVLDKKTLKDALKAGDVVDGAQLTNGGQTLAIRRK